MASWFTKIAQSPSDHVFDHASVWNSAFLNDRDMMVIDSGLAIPVQLRRQIAETKWDLIHDDHREILKTAVEKFHREKSSPTNNPI